MSKKLSLVDTSASSLKEVWECFIISKTSKCVSDAILSNYHHHLRAIAKHLDIEMPLEELSNLPLWFSVSIAYQKEKEKRAEKPSFNKMIELSSKKIINFC